VFLPQNHALRCFPPSIQFAKITVLVTVRLLGAILFPEQLQAHMLVCLQLPIDGGKIQ
jgi:hypothetical protein